MEIINITRTRSNEKIMHPFSFQVFKGLWVEFGSFSISMLSCWQFILKPYDLEYFYATNLCYNKSMCGLIVKEFTSDNL